VKIYLATAMTGRDKLELVQEAKADVRMFARWGIEAHSPVLAEKVRPVKGKLHSWRRSLEPKWKMDKQAMRGCFALVDRTADMKSEGVQHELGFMRYCLFRPVIRVSPRHDAGYFSIANLEDDILVGTIEEAAVLLHHRFGTWYQRFKWQIKVLNRCSLQFLFDHLRGLIL
jgi:hypothetical protein